MLSLAPGGKALLTGTTDGSLLLPKEMGSRLGRIPLAFGGWLPHSEGLESVLTKLFSWQYKKRVLGSPSGLHFWQAALVELDNWYTAFGLS